MKARRHDSSIFCMVAACCMEVVSVKVVLMVSADQAIQRNKFLSTYKLTTHCSMLNTSWACSVAATIPS
jgi:hypothetical protein